MRLAFVLRHRRRLLMPFDTAGSLPSSSAHPHLKRSFAQQATAQRTEDPPSTADALHRSATRENHRPGKVPKIQRAQSPSSTFHAGSATSSTFPPTFEMPTSSAPRSQAKRGGSRSLRTGTSSAPGSRSSSKAKGKTTKTPLSGRLFDDPLHDQDFIIKNYKKDIAGLPLLKETHEENPKSPVSNFIAQTSERLPEFSVEKGFIGAGKERKEMFRYGDSPDFFSAAF
jgi:hypothetical protein